MAQDFAKRKKSGGGRKSTAKKRQGGDKPERGRGLRIYLSGLLSGIFISFIAYLATLPDPGAPAEPAANAQESVEETPRPRWDFYTELPERKIEVEEEFVEPAMEVSKPPTTSRSEQYVLQAGSFTQRQDAENRRAELILLGMTPKIVEAQGERGTVFRVEVGPYDSLESMSKDRGLTTAENIETFVRKRGGL